MDSVDSLSFSAKAIALASWLRDGVRSVTLNHIVACHSGILSSPLFKRDEGRERLSSLVWGPGVAKVILPRRAEPFRSIADSDCFFLEHICQH